MSSLSKDTLETISSWAEMLTVALALASAFCGVVLVLVNRPLKRIEEHEMQEEKRRTAEAQKAAAEAQLELQRNIEYAATPRRIVAGSRDHDEAIRAPKLKELEKFAGTRVLIMRIAGDNEVNTLADDIAGILWRSRWQATITALPANIPLEFIGNGVQLRTTVRLAKDDIEPAGEEPKPVPSPPAVAAVIDFLNLDLGPPRGPIGAVVWDPDAIFPDGNKLGLARYGFNIPDGEIVITVGAKPAWEFFITHNPAVAQKPK